MADATLGSVINWLRQLRVSPHAMPPSAVRIRPVEPPLSVVVTMPVKREPSEERADITRPKPCPPPNATTRSRSANVRLRIKILERFQRVKALPVIRQKKGAFVSILGLILPNFATRCYLRVT